MNELINEARNKWSSFSDVFDVSRWLKVVDRHAYGMILIIKSRKEQLGSILNYYQDNYINDRLIQLGDYVAILGYQDHVAPYFRDLYSIEKSYGTKFADDDCLFIFLDGNTTICSAEDVLRYGRWILMDKQEEYTCEHIDSDDACELEYLLSSLIDSNYYGFENFKFVVDLIESAKKYEYLSLLIGAGLKGCPTAIVYIVSYLRYLKYQQNYYDSNLIKMLIRFCVIDRFMDMETLKLKIEKAFPGERIFEVFEAVYYYERFPKRDFWK
ncbi:MAG: hypothetical protein CVU85_07610 [Firmicutes bacterium HGW-Firmicutes-10]|nr:MAG: hypothetical protein CVU85_07610 [Firmicutes bacterium HGW-Firmicutes-10]